MILSVPPRFVCMGLAILLTGFAWPAAAAEPAKGKPNILFIFTDDQSHRTVSCYPEAYSWARTPNIDLLAKMVWDRPAHPDNAFYDDHDHLISVNGKKAETVKGYPTDNYTKWGVDFIKGKDRAANKPWFLWLCYGAPHAPHTPAPRHLKEYP